MVQTTDVHPLLMAGRYIGPQELPILGGRVKGKKPEDYTDIRSD